MFATTLSEEKPEDPTEQFQQALRLWFGGDQRASTTMMRALSKDPMEVDWWSSLTRSRPWLMKIFKSNDYKEMMEYYNEFIDYNEKIREVGYEYDQLDPADQKKYKHFQSDWFRRFIEIPSRKKEAEREKENKRRRRNNPDPVEPFTRVKKRIPKRSRKNSKRPTQYSVAGGDDVTSTRVHDYDPLAQENKKYSSFDKQQKLTENFRRFLEDDERQED
jgi:hypothetical protein